jgi:aryl-alcohol dehydrogenase-like predicted oxidoreductase
MKFILGSAQVGLQYGVTNYKKKISNLELAKIFKLAKSKKIKFIDTARKYGCAEQKIGIYSKKNFNVITKIPKIPSYHKDISSWVNKQVLKSLKNLKINKIYAVLIHNEQDLIGRNKNTFMNALNKLKLKKIIKYVGISLYNYSNLKKIASEPTIDIIEGPLNIFDQRILLKKNIKILKNKNIKFIARSIFLQGMLLSNFSFIKKFKKLYKLKKHWKTYEDWLKKNNFSKLEGCLNFIYNCKNINFSILGYSSYQELQEILSVKLKKIIIPKFLSLEDDNLINPLKWYIKGSNVPVYKQKSKTKFFLNEK